MEVSAMEEIKIEGKIVTTKEKKVTDFKGYKYVPFFITKEWLYLGQPDKFKVMFVEDKSGKKYIVFEPIKE